MGQGKGISYFKRLAALDPVLKRGNTERVQLVVAGEYPLIIAYNQTPSENDLARRAG